MAAIQGRGSEIGFPARPPGRTLRTLLPALLLVLAAACGGTEEGEPGEAATTEPFAREEAPAPSPQDADEEGARLAELGDFRSASATGSSRFAHDPHGPIECSACHRQPPGHGSHASTRCAACHETAAGGGGGTPTAAECLACHHDPERPDPCTRCHADAEGLPATSVGRTLEIATTGRERLLPFRHATHRDTSCVTCHGQGVTQVESVDCLSCHQRHHGGTTDCASCHQAPREGAHDRDAHSGCSGSGCHDDPTVQALPDTRAFCLSCHRAHEEHEPGRACAPCHQLASARKVGP